MPRKSSPTRETIIGAANELFYREGILKVSMDAIAEQAGVTKRTLYYHFTSKDALIAAALQARDAPTLHRYQEWAGSADDAMSEQMERMFRRLAHWAAHPKWKGCGFARAAAELAGLPGHPGLVAAAAHKRGFEAWLRAGLEAEGHGDPQATARQIMVLLDGAITQILVHHDPSYAHAAGEAAKRLLETPGTAQA